MSSTCGCTLQCFPQSYMLMIYHIARNFNFHHFQWFNDSWKNNPINQLICSFCELSIWFMKILGLENFLLYGSYSVTEPWRTPGIVRSRWRSLRRRLSFYPPDKCYSLIMDGGKKRKPQAFKVGGGTSCNTNDNPDEEDAKINSDLPIWALRWGRIQPPLPELLPRDFKNTSTTVFSQSIRHPYVVNTTYIGNTLANVHLSPDPLLQEILVSTGN